MTVGSEIKKYIMGNECRVVKKCPKFLFGLNTNLLVLSKAMLSERILKISRSKTEVYFPKCTSKCSVVDLHSML